MWYVYVLQSIKTGRYYIGYSKHPEIRLHQHNSGKVRSTKHYVPYKIVRIEEYQTKTEAIKRERELKKMKSGLKFKSTLNAQW